MKHKFLRNALSLALALCLLAPAALGDEAFEVNAALQDEWVEEAGVLSLGEYGVTATEDAAPTEAAEAAESVVSNEGLVVESEDVSNDAAPQPQDITLQLSGSEARSANIGDTLHVTINVEGASVKKWASTKKSVASMENEGDGVLIRPIKEGTCKITATLSNKKKIILNLTVNDPYKPSDIHFEKDGAVVTSMTVPAGAQIDLRAMLRVTPSYINPSLTWKGSGKSVATLSSDGILTTNKAGNSKVTVTSTNKKRATLAVTVLANKVEGLSPKPSNSQASQYTDGWSLIPYAMEVSKGALACQFYVINGTDSKLNALDGLNICVSVGDRDRVISHQRLDRVRINVASKKVALVKIILPITGDMTGVFLPDYKNAGTLFIDINTNAYAISGNKSYRIIDPSVTYRALLIGEVNFSAREICNRNGGDVQMLGDTLDTVYGPKGRKYAVTKRTDLNRDNVLGAIRSTFSGADEDDVSLFFIASHGDSTSAGVNAGSLVLAPRSSTNYITLAELADVLREIPGKIIVIIESCGSGAGVYVSDIEQNGAAPADAVDFDAEVAEINAFDQAVIDAFADADPGMVVNGEPDYIGSDGAIVSNSGELRVENKFYVLVASRYQEESYGTEDSSTLNIHNGYDAFNFFTYWLVNGIGKEGAMPADTDGNGTATLNELFKYISSVGDNYPFKISGVIYYQHVQVYPKNSDFALFSR